MVFPHKRWPARANERKQRRPESARVLETPRAIECANFTKADKRKRNQRGAGSAPPGAKTSEPIPICHEALGLAGWFWTNFYSLAVLLASSARDRCYPAAPFDGSLNSRLRLILTALTRPETTGHARRRLQLEELTVAKVLDMAVREAFADATASVGRFDKFVAGELRARANLIVSCCLSLPGARNVESQHRYLLQFLEQIPFYLTGLVPWLFRWFLTDLHWPTDKTANWALEIGTGKIQELLSANPDLDPHRKQRKTVPTDWLPERPARLKRSEEAQ
jgi:hypothetical protein